MQISEQRQGFSAGILILAVGLSVRFPLTSVSPVLEQIGQHYSLSTSGLAFLSSIPVILFGLTAPLAPVLSARLGTARAINILLAALAIATLLRPLTTQLLFAGTVVIGTAIAMLGVLAPQLIRLTFPTKAGLWAGIYTTSFGLSAALGAALTVPALYLFKGHVAVSLMSWTIPLLIAFGLALSQSRRIPKLRTSRRTPFTGANASILRTPGLWPVTGFFACQALLYFTLTAWLPTLALARGMQAPEAGFLLALMNLIGLPAALIIPTLASRSQLRTSLVIGVAIASALGLLGLAWAPVELLPAAVALLGVAQSSAFGLAIAFIVFTAPSPELTAGFSAVSQSIGYLCAAIGPLIVGVFADLGVSWEQIVLVLIAVTAGELAYGYRAARVSTTMRVNESNR